MGCSVTAAMDTEGSSSPGRVAVSPSEGFVTTHAVRAIAERALAYLRAGFPVHFCGPTGTGKSTLAFHVAAQLGRPVVLLHGDHLLTSADLVGSTTGTRTSRLIDNYVRSVVKMEEEKRELWVDNRLTTACRMGHTLIYDEFNRTSPEANNPLLSVLSERILNLPKAYDGRESYIQVHRRFNAILTSNPEEYAGVFKTPDALMDRLITIHLAYYDAETEVQIVAARTGVALADAEQLVQLVRELREHRTGRERPTIRAAITLGRIVKSVGTPVARDSEFFRALCQDVLGIDLQSLDAVNLSVSAAASGPEAPPSNPAPAAPLAVEPVQDERLAARRASSAWLDELAPDALVSGALP